MSYENVFLTLQRYRVRYLIAGGMAVNLYGIPRFTKDLDLMISPSKANLERLEEALRKLGYRPKVPVLLKEFLNPTNWPKWKKEKGMIAFPLHNSRNPFEEIDLLINVSLKFEDANRRKATVRQGNMRVHLVSINDLIRMKKTAGRDQDKADIESLKKVKRLKKVK